MSEKTFEHFGFQYVAYSEDCPKCKKPLAYHGRSERHAEVSCPRCGIKSYHVALAKETNVTAHNAL